MNILPKNPKQNSAEGYRKHFVANKLFDVFKFFERR